MVWKISILPPTYSSARHFSSFLRTAPMTMSVTDSLLFHNSFRALTSSRTCPCFGLTSLSFFGHLEWQNPRNEKFFRSFKGLVFWPRLGDTFVTQRLFPTQSCQVLKCICANLLHSLLIGIALSYQSQHSQHLHKSRRSLYHPLMLGLEIPLCQFV